jgi:hypothetical protein
MNSSVRDLQKQIDELRQLLEVRKPVKDNVESFIAPVLTGGWINIGGTFGTAGYFKDSFGVVHLRGLVASGVLGSAAFTLEVGYRPEAICRFPVVANDAFGEVSIDAAGAVTLVVGSPVFFSLDGITFKAA